MDDMKDEFIVKFQEEFLEKHTKAKKSKNVWHNF